MFRNIFTHTQPTVILLKLLHLVLDRHVVMSLPEVAGDRLAVLNGQIQSLERWDIWSPSRAVDPGSAMLVDEQIAVEIVEFDLVVLVQGCWPLGGHAKFFDELQIEVFFLGLQKFGIVRSHGIDLGRRHGAKMQRNS